MKQRVLSADGDVVGLIAALPYASDVKAMVSRHFELRLYPVSDGAYKEIKKRVILRKATHVYIYHKIEKERRM